MRIRFAAALLLFLVARNVQADLVTCWNFNSEDGLAATTSVGGGLGVIFFEPQESQSPAGLLAIITGTSAHAVSWDPTASAPSLDICSDVLPTWNPTVSRDPTEYADLVLSACLASSNSTDSLSTPHERVSLLIRSTGSVKTPASPPHLLADNMPFPTGDFDGLPEPSSLALSIVAAAILLPLVRWRLDRPEMIPPETASPSPRRTRRPRPVFKQRLSDIFGANRSDRIH